MTLSGGVAARPLQMLSLARDEGGGLERGERRAEHARKQHPPRPTEDARGLNWKADVSLLGAACFPASPQKGGGITVQPVLSSECAKERARPYFLIAHLSGQALLPRMKQNSGPSVAVHATEVNSTSRIVSIAGA